MAWGALKKFYMKRTTTFKYKMDKYWYAISGSELLLVVMSLSLLVSWSVGQSFSLFVEKINISNFNWMFGENIQVSSRDDSIQHSSSYNNHQLCLELMYQRYFVLVIFIKIHFTGIVVPLKNPLFHLSIYIWKSLF